MANSRRRPAETGWESDEDDLLTDAPGISAFKNEEEEFDEDALLGFGEDGSSNKMAGFVQGYEDADKDALEIDAGVQLDDIGLDEALDYNDDLPQEDPAEEQGYMHQHDGSDDFRQVTETSSHEVEQDFHSQTFHDNTSQDEHMHIGISHADKMSDSDSGSDKESDKHERGRFKSERSTIISTLKVKARTDIPDTLEMSENQQPNIENFARNKNYRQGRRQRGGFHNNRVGGPYRDLAQRGRPVYLGGRRGLMGTPSRLRSSHSRFPQQTVGIRMPLPVQDMMPHMQFGPGPLLRPSHPIQQHPRPLHPAHMPLALSHPEPRPLFLTEASSGPPRPHKILINPNFRGPMPPSVSIANTLAGLQQPPLNQANPIFSHPSSSGTQRMPISSPLRGVIHRPAPNLGSPGGPLQPGLLMEPVGSPRHNFMTNRGPFFQGQQPLVIQQVEQQGRHPSQLITVGTRPSVPPQRLLSPQSQQFQLRPQFVGNQPRPLMQQQRPPRLALFTRKNQAKAPNAVAVAKKLTQQAKVTQQVKAIQQIVPQSRVLQSNKAPLKRQSTDSTEVVTAKVAKSETPVPEEAPMDEELRRGLERQKQLREQIRKRKEDARKRAAEARRIELEARLAEQGLTIDDISTHDKEPEENKTAVQAQSPENSKPNQSSAQTTTLMSGLQPIQTIVSRGKNQKQSLQSRFASAPGQIPRQAIPNQPRPQLRQSRGQRIPMQNAPSLDVPTHQSQQSPYVRSHHIGKVPEVDDANPHIVQQPYEKRSVQQLTPNPFEQAHKKIGVAGRLGAAPIGQQTLQHDVNQFKRSQLANSPPLTMYSEEFQHTQQNFTPLLHNVHQVQQTFQQVPQTGQPAQHGLQQVPQTGQPVQHSLQQTHQDYSLAYQQPQSSIGYGDTQLPQSSNRQLQQPLQQIHQLQQPSYQLQQLQHPTLQLQYAHDEHSEMQQPFQHQPELFQHQPSQHHQQLVKSQQQPVHQQQPILVQQTVRGQQLVQRQRSIQKNQSVHYSQEMSLQEQPFQPEQHFVQTPIQHQPALQKQFVQRPSQHQPQKPQQYVVAKTEEFVLTQQHPQQQTFRNDAQLHKSVHGGVARANLSPGRAVIQRGHDEGQAIFGQFQPKQIHQQLAPPMHPRVVQAKASPQIQAQAILSQSSHRTVIPAGSSVKAAIAAVNRAAKQEGQAVQTQRLVVQQGSSVANRTVAAPKVVSGPITPQSVSVDNLSASTKEEELKKICETIGPVKNIVMMSSMRKAIITFCSKVHAVAFAQKWNRRMVNLSMITVTLLS